MNIISKVIGTVAKTAAATTAVLMFLVGPAYGGGINGLLGVIPGVPQVDSTGVVGQGCTFVTNGNGGTLTVTSTPGLYISLLGLEFINPGGLLTINAELDAAGNVISGDIVINGTTPSGLTDPMLTGDLVAIGLANLGTTPGATDQGDFRFDVTGGSIPTADPLWPAGSDIGATLTLEGSTYDLAPGAYRAGVTLPALSLAPGAYSVNVSVMSAVGNHHYCRRAPAVVISSEVQATFDGLLGLEHNWIEPERY